MDYFTEATDKINTAWDKVHDGVMNVHDTYGIDPINTALIAVVTIILLALCTFGIKWFPQKWTIGVVVVMINMILIIWGVYAILCFFRVGL